MTPSARVQSAIEILDRIIDAAKRKGAPADRIMAEWARTNRYAGSKDRRAIRDFVYGAIRASGPVPLSGRAAMLRLAQVQPEITSLFDGSKYGPSEIGEGEEPAVGGPAAPWLVKHLAKSGIDATEAAALLDRAPLDLRVNSLKAERESIALPVEGEPLLAPIAMRFPAGTPVEQWPEFRGGLVEVQDHGSQWACAAVNPSAGETIIDLCAGAGGKTLALAAMMQNQGTLIACDTDRGRLSRLAPRAEKAGASMVRTILLNPGKELEMLADYHAGADAVLVDAPCSGTGTWRRNPEARWRLGKAELQRFAEVQSRLLDIATRLVKPGGRIIYVTCSLLDEEGAERIDMFLSANEGWSAEPLNLPIGRPHGQGTRLTPYHDGTDGFFIARLASAC